MFFHIIALLSHESARANAQLARAQRLEQEKVRQARLLEARRSLLPTARSEAAVLSYTAPFTPQETYIETQFLAQALEKNGIHPASFEDAAEKEEAAMLLRSLQESTERSQSLLTDAQLEQCQRCLEAVSAREHLLQLSHRLSPYKAFLRIKAQRDQARGAHRKAHLGRLLSWAVSILLAAITFMIYAGRVGLEMAAGDLIFWVMGVLILAFLAYRFIDRLEPKRLAQLEQVCAILSRHACAEDREFWQFVDDRFGGIPDEEHLIQDLADLEQTITEILGEPWGNPYANLSIPNLEDVSS